MAWDRDRVVNEVAGGIAGNWGGTFQIQENLDGVIEGPASGAPLAWGAHTPFVDEISALSNDHLVTGFDKITLGPAGSEVDYKIWAWDLYFLGMENDISTSANARALRLTFRNSGGGSLGTFDSGFAYYSASNPANIFFRIFNFGQTGARENLIHTYGSAQDGTENDGGVAGAAYAGTVNWNEIKVGHQGTGAITAGRLVRVAHFYPSYHL